MEQVITGQQLIAIGDRLTSALDGMSIGNRVIRRSIVEGDVDLNNAVSDFVKQVYEQELLDAGIKTTPPPEKVSRAARDRVNPSASTNEGRLWSVVNSLGNLTATLVEATPSAHDIQSARKTFIDCIREASGGGQHAAKEICDQIQHHVCSAVHETLGSQRR